MEALQLPETTSVADLAPKPIPKPTREQMGKMRKAYFTKYKHTVKACGHKLDISRPPKTKCEDCWEAYFKEAPSADIVGVHGELSEHGSQFLEKKYGIRFLKAFRKFMNNELTKGADAVSEETSRT